MSTESQICINWDVVECQTSQSVAAQESTERFKRQSSHLNEDLCRVSVPRKPELRLLNKWLIFLKKRVLYKSQLLFIQALLFHQQLKSCQRSLSKLRYGYLNMHQDGGVISFNKKNGGEWRTQNILGSKKDRTFWHWCPLWRWKDPIHSFRGISACLNVGSCLPTLTLWATRTKANSDMKMKPLYLYLPWVLSQQGLSTQFLAF